MDPKIAPCGVDCSVCADNITNKCPSCRLTEWTDDDICPPVKCCAEKDIDFCGFCDTFPCGIMAEFYEESDSHKEAYIRMCEVKNREMNSDPRKRRPSEKE